jgi:hypothetical protein
MFRLRRARRNIRRGKRVSWSEHSTEKPVTDRTLRSPEEELDRALEDSFPASDPISVANPTIGTKAAVPPDDDLDDRIRRQAEKLWQEANRPSGGADAFLDQARTLIAIEDNPHAGTLPNPMTQPDKIGPQGEPIEPIAEVADEGEFPTLTDQGEQVYPPRRSPPAGK